MDRTSLSLACLLATALLAGCAPAPSPAIAPTPRATPGSAPAPSSVSPATAPTPTAEDAAWDRVVSTAKKEAKLTIYSFNYTGELGLAISRTFQEKYGISVDIITGRGAEFIERLKTEARMGQMMADMSEGSSVNVMNMKDSGLTVAVPDLPTLKEKDVWVSHPLTTDAEAHVINYFPTIWSPWVNTRLVKPADEPKSFSDLLKPEWKGKMGTHDPNTSSSPYLYYVPLINQKVLDWDYVRAIGKQEQRLAPGPVQVADLLNRSQVPLVAMNTDSTMAVFVAEGAPVKAISLREGEVNSLGGAVAIKGAPHPNAAKLFINWLLTSEGQTIYAKYKALSSVRKDVPDFRPHNARAPYTKLIATTGKDYQDGARLQRERFIIEMWKK